MHTDEVEASGETRTSNLLDAEKCESDVAHDTDDLDEVHPNESRTLNRFREEWQAEISVSAAARALDAEVVQTIHDTARECDRREQKMLRLKYVDDLLTVSGDTVVQQSLRNYIGSLEASVAAPTRPNPQADESGSSGHSTMPTLVPGPPLDPSDELQCFFCEAWSEDVRWYGLDNEGHQVCYACLDRGDEEAEHGTEEQGPESEEEGEPFDNAA